MLRIGIFGATGYTGLELVRLLQNHRQARLVFAHSESNPGAKLSDIIPCLYDVPLIKADDAPLADVDVVFSCLPHAASAELAARVLAAGKKVVDLSADFRLTNAAVYEKTYKHVHPHPELLTRAVYGLPERYRERIAQTDLVANPGCYPTSTILPALPLLEAGALAEPVLIADSKSGVSGAGRKPSTTTHFVEVNEGLTPYNVANVHRHVPEIDQVLNDIDNGRTPGGVNVIFTPHLLPISRGMLTTLYVRLTPEARQTDWQSVFEKRYANEPFVRVLPRGQTASIAHVARTNMAAISLHPLGGAVADRLLLVCAIDNLTKGASGQALQNMNLMFGLDEREGLR
ncbi:MAG: N-acetyl-gamma-glutamyl-phosphate reductase [Thermoflexales bacterium]|nr:N-acetyl-gamma-glutamyl-phosphate reductase [Thermoflexales bacterium]